MSMLFRVLTGALGAACLALAVGFATETTWVVALYPWPDGRLSHLWVGAMLAGYGLPLGWLALSGERRAAGPGYLALALTGLLLGWHFNEEMLRQQRPLLSRYATGALVFGLACSGMACWAALSPESALRRSSPLWLRRWVLGPVVAVVAVVAVLLLQQWPHVFPWPLKPATSVLFGWVFATSGLYHAFAVFRPEWRHAKGQLLGFVGYNAVLFGPYLGHFQTVLPGHFASLLGFFTLIVLTSFVAIFILLKRAPEGEC